MRWEPPEFKRCCFCLPLRRGLIGWGYVKVVLDVMATVYCVIASFFVLLFSGTLLHLVMVVVIISLLLVDIVYTILLIIAGHMKSAKLLRIYFIYSVVWLVLILVFDLCATAGSLLHMLELWTYGHYERVLSALLSSAVLLFSITFVNVYVSLLIRSEEKKLRNQSLEVQFVNSAAEGRAACVRAAIAEV